MPAASHFGRILVPLDGTALAEAVLPASAALAGMAGARVTLLHVMEAGAPQTVHGQAHLQEVESAESYLRRTAETAFPPGLAVDWHVHHEGIRDVAGALADHAIELEQDLVVVRAHGEGGIRDWLSGNIAQQVVKRRVVPVLLLAEAPGGRMVFPFRRILVPLDGEPQHDAVLPVVAAFAALCRAEIHLLSIVPEPGTAREAGIAVAGGFLPRATREVLALRHEAAAAHLKSVAEGLSRHGLSIAVNVSKGAPLPGIAKTANTIAADLVALGTHGKAGTKAFWEGSLAQQIVRRIPASFLLVPAPRT